MPEERSPIPPPNGWVLFDGSCGFCNWWIPLWSSLLRSNGYGIEELQAGWIRERLDLSEDELLSDIRILLPNGQQILGANAYRDVMGKVWWLIPIYFLSVLPGGRQVFDLSYKLFNKNRFRVSRACRMSLRHEKGDR